jgi:hypothetical protein
VPTFIPQELKKMINIDQTNPIVKNYRAAVSELQELQNQLGTVSNEIDSKTQKLVLLRHRPRSERLADEAQAMLSSGVIDESTGPMMEEINELKHRLEVTEAAVEMQKQLVDRTRGPFSAMVNEGLRSRHREIVSRIAKGVLEAAQGFDDEIRLFDEITQAGAAPMFRPMRVGAIGSLSNQNSVATFFIRELREYFPEIKV